MVPNARRPIHPRGTRRPRVAAGGDRARSHSPAPRDVRPHRVAPEPHHAREFERDDSPHALERVVDRLLDSPHYGERWGRHWLDVARYADTAGETADYPVPLAWRYRNWVIDAFNADKPYDEFVREQIAGDVLARSAPREDYEHLLTATGYLAVARRFGFGVAEHQHLTIQDTIDTIGQSVLGLTLGCARCHDHKFDPVTSADYYAWYGIFDSSKYSLPGDEKTKTERNMHPAVPAAEVVTREAEHKSALEALNAQIPKLEAEREQLRSASLELVDPDRQAAFVTRYFDERKLATAIVNDGGHEGLLIWRGAGPLPIVGMNVSDATLEIPGMAPPRTVIVHPDVQNGAGVAWRSPLDGRVRIEGDVRDAHACGNGIAWHLDHIGARGSSSCVRRDRPERARLLRPTEPGGPRGSRSAKRRRRAARRAAEGWTRL